MSETPEVRIRVEGDVGLITLDRPRALHALTREMCVAMSEALLAWRGDDEVDCVLIDHAEGTRGFCAGGDVAMLRRSALEDGGAAARAFFADEYRLNHLLFAYPKPVVVFMDGVAMGGGVGLALPASHRVVTENTRLAMPETAIGLFPDVGAGWYLSRLPGRLGQYLALTGARLDGPECVWAGLGTDYLPSAALPSVKACIVGGEYIQDTLDGFALTPPAPGIAAHADAIAAAFASDRLEDVLGALAADPGEWARAMLAALRTRSPQACKVALRQFAQGARLSDFTIEMSHEYRIAARVVLRPDFAEGVRAVIVDKTNDAAWRPPTPEGVDDALLDAIFAPLPPGEEWRPLPRPAAPAG